MLACLSQSKPPSDAELGDAVQQLALPAASSDTANTRAAELLAVLVRRGWVTSNDPVTRRDARRKASQPRMLTDNGKRVLRGAFQLARVPTWSQVRDKHMPHLALGITAGSERAATVGSESTMMAAILCARFDIRGARTPVAVCDALIAQALGMTAGKLTLDRIRAHVLARGIDSSARDAPSPSGKSYAPRLASWIACSVVGASEPPRKKVARALARRWVCNEPPVRGLGSTYTAVAKPSPAPDKLVAVPPVAEPAPDLLHAVRDTIPRIGTEGRFGEKVYVSAIWRSITRERKASDLSLDYFKRWLIGANRDGWLVLARADLIGAMDAKQVTESEINDRGATFHFVLDQPNGASRSQESHAG
ncbi:MAG: hypothetical protein H7138_10790 [Myxococcales bacterium]|nr:hypothetical protein [Myxococcales bacterium]